MEDSIKACVIIGIKVTKDELLPKMKRPGCSHVVGQTLAKDEKFCRVCGVPVQVDSRGEVPDVGALVIWNIDGEGAEYFIGGVVAHVADHEAYGYAAIPDCGTTAVKAREVRKALRGTAFEDREIKMWLYLEESC